MIARSTQSTADDQHALCRSNLRCMCRQREAQCSPRARRRKKRKHGAAVLRVPARGCAGPPGMARHGALLLLLHGAAAHARMHVRACMPACASACAHACRMSVLSS